MNNESPSEETAAAVPFGFLNPPAWRGSYDSAHGPTQMRAQHLALMAYFLAGESSGSHQSTPQNPSSGQS